MVISLENPLFLPDSVGHEVEISYHVDIINQEGNTFFILKSRSQVSLSHEPEQVIC